MTNNSPEINISIRSITDLKTQLNIRGLNTATEEILKERELNISFTQNELNTLKASIASLSNDGEKINKLKEIITDKTRAETGALKLEF